MWYLYVTDVGLLPPKIAADYGRLGALISVGPGRGGDVPGASWVELDPDSIPDADWDEATSTLVDSGRRFQITYAEFWDRLTDAEQDDIYDLATTNQAANRLVERIRMNLARPEGHKLINLQSAKAQNILDYLVTQGILTTQRKAEIVGT